MLSDHSPFPMTGMYHWSMGGALTKNPLSMRGIPWCCFLKYPEDRQGISFDPFMCIMSPMDHGETDPLLIRTKPSIH